MLGRKWLVGVKFCGWGTLCESEAQKKRILIVWVGTKVGGGCSASMPKLGVVARPGRGGMLRRCVRADQPERAWALI